jgi:hypothetical protein
LIPFIPFFFSLPLLSARRARSLTGLGLFLARTLLVLE